MLKETENRFFFGLETIAPWPENHGKGRLLEEKDIHLTILFLGEVNVEKLQELLNPPKPSFLFAPFGKFDEVLFLPRRMPRTVSWHTEWIEGEEELQKYREELVHWVKNLGFKVDERPFLPHVTIARSPRHFHEWKENFQELPFFCRALHLYKSLGYSKYEPIWSHIFQVPFLEIEHTADVAFKVYGNSIPNLLLHAEEALFYQFPELLPFFVAPQNEQTLEAVIQRLNEIVAAADSQIGSPCKAVSYHGELKKENGLFVWEMIIDV